MNNDLKKSKKFMGSDSYVKSIRIGKRVDIASLKVVRFRLPESFISHREEWMDIRKLDNW